MSSMNLRLPDDLHELLRDLAAQDKRSLNSYIVVALERDSAGKTPPPRPRRTKPRTAEPGGRVWTADDRVAILQVAGALLEMDVFVVDEAADAQLAELRDDVAAGESTPMLAADVREAVRVLGRAPEVKGMPAWPRVRDRWRELDRAR